MRAVLDACVLYPTILREILIGMADAGAYHPIWTTRIDGEWRRAAARQGILAAAEAESALLALSHPPAPAPDLIPGVDLPDPADLHVLAAALEHGAEWIVTFNLRDFPRATLAPFGVTALHPDAFLLMLYDTHGGDLARVVAASHAKARALGAEIEMRAMLKRARLPRVARALAR